MPILLGIDPGLSGAGALLDVRYGHKPKLLTVWDMPLTTESLTSRNKTRPVLDLPKLATLMAHPAFPAPHVCVIEKVGAAPGQGVTSMFRFGYSAGATAGIAAALGLPTFYVQPKLWKRRAHIPARAPKHASCAKARAAVTGIPAVIRRLGDHGPADAVLIALHGWEPDSHPLEATT